jgi:lysophospholipase L1-like esterase
MDTAQPEVPGDVDPSAGAGPRDGAGARVPWWKQLLFVAIYCAVSLTVFELVARLAAPPSPPLIQREHEQVIQVLGLPALNRTMQPDPILFWALRPNLREMVYGRIHGKPIDFFVTTNTLGLRGSSVAARGKAARVIALGDSCTFGIGVADDATWPAQMGTILNGTPGGGGYEVINAGVPGYTAFQGLRYLSERGLALEPDIVVAGFGFNDASSWASRSDFDIARGMAMRGWDEALARSRLYVALRDLALWIRPPRIPLEGFGHPRLSAKEFSATLLKMHAILRERKVRLVLLVWPFEYQLDPKETKLEGYQQLVAAVGKSADIDTVDLREAFRKAPGYPFIDHIHANATGCRVAAEAIAAVVREGGGRRPGGGSDAEPAGRPAQKSE